MNTVADKVALAQLESERLYEYLENLPGEAWGYQSACQRWTVADVVTHMGQGAQFYGQFISLGLRGDTAPPEGFLQPGEADSGVLGEALAQMAISDTESLGDQLLSTFKCKDGDLHRLLAGINPEHWETLCFHPMSLLPISALVTFRVFELALHGWDIRSSLDTEAHLSAESLPCVMELITMAFPTIVKPSPVASLSRHRFGLHGLLDGVYDLVVEGGAARLEKNSSATPVANLRCDAETFALLLTGRRTLDSAVSTGLLTVDDSYQLPSDFGQWFKGLYRPSE